MILGIDEVGRGCWAGPLVVGAVILNGSTIDGLTDSKKLTSKRREELAVKIRQQAKAVGLGWVSAGHVDARGLSWALQQAACLAVAAIHEPFTEIIIDGTVKLIDDERVTLMKKADLLVPSVSAASIIAKVARDAYMKQVAHAFPQYGFERHVGYGTQVHQIALRQHGASPLHRLTFAPLAEHRKLFRTAEAIEATAGRQAERFAAAYLEQEGFKIVATNWRTKWCEIDIVARKGSTIHFVEVKYRLDDSAGDGIAAVTPHKVAKMRFAAELWLQEKELIAEHYALSVMALTGEPLRIQQWVPHI